MSYNAVPSGKLRRSRSSAICVARSAVAAAAAAAALAGCSSGQAAETATLKPPISGLNTQSPDGSLLIRNLQVLYAGPAGYPAGGTAPLQVSLFNETEQPMTVVIRSAPPTVDVPPPGYVTAQRIALTGGTAAASPSANPEPAPGGKKSPHPSLSAGEVNDPSGAASTAPTPGASLVSGSAGQPAQITIPALGEASFQPTMAQKLLAVGLSGRFSLGKSLSLVLERGAGLAPMNLLAPMEVPLSPVPVSAGVSTAPEKNMGEGQ
ncbi:hypothetical protein ODJ79_25565 [Actinoplanes sp. KI2]|uniref:hypothetical protein n=1 Tax=Actinoplanes sp. KI2 TaxID=2983315 RepID=UPI0021D5D4F3|nr:hypothetical protein [Actinoplanes sp. KI2]MCU7727110.1 hypothetical protein [Actinoplanes sp. KI2]